MTQFKVGDRVKIGPNSIGVAVGTIFTVVDTLQVRGVWVDVNRKEVMLKYVDKGSKNCFADFTLVEEEKVKNKFAVGDRVISTKNTPQTPEGWIGYVETIIPESKYSIHASKEGSSSVLTFQEDELELLSAAKDRDWSNRDDITPQDIAGVPKSALDKQVGGGHYKSKGIQPIEYIFANNLGFCESNIVKYATRWKDKNGIQDLEKIIHYTELLIELTKKEELKDKDKE